MPKTSKDDPKTYKNPNDLVGGFFDLILTEIWLGYFQVKTKYWYRLIFPNGHWSESSLGNPRWKIESI